MALLSLGITLSCIVLALLFSQYQKLKRIRAAIQQHPGISSLFDNASIRPGFFGISSEKRVALQHHSIFQKYGCDVISAVSLLPKPAMAFYVSDPLVAKEIMIKTWIFPKDTKEYCIFNIFGASLFVLNGTEWKRHRRICAPTFSEKTNEYAWNVACKNLSNTFSSWQHEHVIQDLLGSFTFWSALKVFSEVGFGIPFDVAAADNHAMSFGEALHVVSTDGYLKQMVPAWAMGLTPRLRKTKLAHQEFLAYVRRMVVDRTTNDEAASRVDLLSNLLAANAAEDPSAKIDDDEFLGNVYMIFFAGHETSAHTLAFALRLLATHQDQQETLYKHIMSIMGNAETPNYKDLRSYTYTLAVLNETLRMYPPVTCLPKVCAQDTVVSASTAYDIDEKMPVLIPEGAQVMIDVPGVHYNSKYWSDPYTFDPTRFLGKYNEDAFIPFSGQSRACLGRKFFEAEAVATVNMIISRYRIEPAKGLSGISKLPKAEAGLMIRPEPLPVVFRRRDTASK